MTHSEKIGERIRELRLQSRMKGEDLGEILKVSKAQISSIERGKSKLNTDQLAVLSDTFKVSVSYLMCEERPETPSVDYVKKLEQRVRELETLVANFLLGGKNILGKCSPVSLSAIAPEALKIGTLVAVSSTGKGRSGRALK